MTPDAQPTISAPISSRGCARSERHAPRHDPPGGAGCQGAHGELIALAGALRAPLVHALRGKEFVEYDHPYDVGMTGVLRFESGYRAMEHCDALLMLGTDFPYRRFSPDDAKVVHADIRGEHIGRRVAVDVGLVGTVKDTAQALMPHTWRPDETPPISSSCAITTGGRASGWTGLASSRRVGVRSILG